MRLCKHRKKKSSIAFFITYFLKIILQMKENAVYLLLDRKRFFWYVLIFPTSQSNTHPTTNNQSKCMWCHSRINKLSSKHNYWPMIFYNTPQCTQPMPLHLCIKYQHMDATYICSDFVSLTCYFCGKFLFILLWSLVILIRTDLHLLNVALIFLSRILLSQYVD